MTEDVKVGWDELLAQPIDDRPEGAIGGLGEPGGPKRFALTRDLDIPIPRSTVTIIKEGMDGIHVWAVQRLCTKMGFPTAEDSKFGPATAASVKKLQQKLNLTADGVVGPVTQRTVAKLLAQQQEREELLPANILVSKINYESAGYLGAVNWSVAGGVDCGITQRRVYEHEYDDEVVIRRAFDAVYQVNLSGNRVSELYSIFRARAGVGTTELAWRLTILNHNYPSLADRISRFGIASLSAYYRNPQEWVTVHRLVFPDGTPIRTPLEWGQRYSLGNRDHDEPGQAVKLVTSWSAAT